MQAGILTGTRPGLLDMAGPSPMPMSTEVSSENFNEEAYLAQNGDVARAIKAGMFASAWDHFIKTGRQERRRQRLTASVSEARARKIGRVGPHLRTDMPYQVEDGRLNFLTRELRRETRIAETENVSANPYDEEMMQLIETHKGGLILDCGAGRRDIYFENVVNYEIVGYDSTDIIGVGEQLPFQSNTFDAVFSIAVLEHVRDPFRCAAEIARVLKRGGQLYCCMPFLQPLHGFPHHYFNATPQGARRLFEDFLRVQSVSVPRALHPVWALSWIVRSWSEGLDERTRMAFLNMQLKELAVPPEPLLIHPFARDLSSEKRFELATGTIVKAVKERTDADIAGSPVPRSRSQAFADWLRKLLRSP
jgi:SAM-dependent methyltransferase